MNRETKLATYWTAAGIGALVVLALVAWWVGAFEAAPK